MLNNNKTSFLNNNFPDYLPLTPEGDAPNPPRKRKRPPKTIKDGAASRPSKKRPPKKKKMEYDEAVQSQVSRPVLTQKQQQQEKTILPLPFLSQPVSSSQASRFQPREATQRFQVSSDILAPRLAAAAHQPGTKLGKSGIAFSAGNMTSSLPASASDAVFFPVSLDNIPEGGTVVVPTKSGQLSTVDAKALLELLTKSRLNAKLLGNKFIINSAARAGVVHVKDENSVPACEASDVRTSVANPAVTLASVSLPSDPKESLFCTPQSSETSVVGTLHPNRRSLDAIQEILDEGVEGSSLDAQGGENLNAPLDLADLDRILEQLDYVDVAQPGVSSQCPAGDQAHVPSHDLTPDSSEAEDEPLMLTDTELASNLPYLFTAHAARSSTTTTTTSPTSAYIPQATSLAAAAVSSTQAGCGSYASSYVIVGQQLRAAYTPSSLADPESSLDSVSSSLPCSRTHRVSDEEVRNPSPSLPDDFLADDDEE
jgi:hypothetical protein